MVLSHSPCSVECYKRHYLTFKTQHSSEYIQVFVSLGSNSDLLRGEQKPICGNGGPSEAKVLPYACTGTSYLITRRWAGSGFNHCVSFWSGLPFLLCTTRCHTFTAKLYFSTCTMETNVFSYAFMLSWISSVLFSAKCL